MPGVQGVDSAAAMSGMALHFVAHLAIAAQKNIKCIEYLSLA